MIVIIEAASMAVMLGLILLFLLTLLSDSNAWFRFWRGLSRPFNRFRRTNILLGPIAAAVTLSLLYPLATTAGETTTMLWVVVAVYSIWWSVKGQTRDVIRRRRYTKYLREGFALPVAIGPSGGNYGWMDKFSQVIGLPMRSVVAIGASGAGKTEVVKHFVRRMLGDDSSMMFVFDRKTSFQEFFETLNIDYIRISLEDSTIVPNFFQEFRNEDDVDEFARSLFPQSEDKDFFATSSQHVFAAVIKTMIRNNGGVEGLSNANIKRYFQQSTAEDVYEDLMEYEDFRGVATAIDAENAGKQATGVYASVQNTVEDMFRGDFAREPASERANEREGFSIRKYRENPCGVPVVFDLPTEHTEAVKPIFRFLLDHAAMHGMAATERQSNFVLDEFAQIPYLRRLEEVVNVGREQNVSTVVCLQSVKQLIANYGEDYGTSILAGLTSKILLRPNDEETVKFIRESVGTEFHEYTRTSTDALGREIQETEVQEEHVFSRGEIRKWSSGVGVVVTQQGWVKGYIPMLWNSSWKHMRRVVPLPSDRMFDMDFDFVNRDVLEDDDEYRADWAMDSGTGEADWTESTGSGADDD